jgi:glycyl-tRNA synthetase
MATTDLMDKVLSLAKRRGFVFAGSEIYGGLANSWDYGPLGAQLKKNIKDLWWRMFVQERGDVVGLDAAIIMNPKVWEASGHVGGFSDPLVECLKCHSRYRADQLEGSCLNCGGKEFTEEKKFNLLFQTNIGPLQSTENAAYLRPETAQAMFVDFKHVLDTTRMRPPFGIAQMGKAFRNEITPGNFIFRTREFEQMEIEYFVHPDSWEEHFEQWRVAMHAWLEAVGADKGLVHEHEIGDGDRAFYSKRTIDFEFDYPFGRKELYGLAYRTDYDLSRHQEASGKNLSWRDPDTGMEYTPHVIEPSFGVDRTLLVAILSAFDDSDPERVVLRLKPQLAPFKAAVFPLLKNKPELVAKAQEVCAGLRKRFSVAWDDRGNIGKRYLAQDEIGTPACVTIDFQTLEDDTVTVRDRDSKEQIRIPVVELPTHIQSLLIFP